ILHPVTGGLAYEGEQCRKGAQLALEEINAAGGIKSMGGAKLEAALGDAQGRPEIAASLVEQMADQGVAAFTGAYSSALGLAATQAAAKAGLPFSIDSGISDALTSRGLGNVFRFFPANSGFTNDAMTALDAINKKAGSPAKTAIVVHEDSEFGTSTAKLLASKLPPIGIEVRSIIAHATPTRDFTNIALRIKSEKPDLVLMTNYPGEYVLLARTLVQQRVELAGMYSVSGGGFNLKFAKEQPQVADTMMDFNHWYNPRDPRGPAFRKRIEDQGAVFSWEVLFGYFAVRLLADAMERAGTAEKTKLIDALGASTFADHFMPYGPTRFVGGQNQGARATAQQVQKGDIAVIWPEQFADAPAVFPRPKV
ncbi:MAG: ABC transporter substrate-binding protein, partial [Gemmatimonadaceae bacterium]|nr:ABC transporter substrate-binding protein [Acetobacteraceae bacterium]